MVVALVDMERAFVPPQHFIRLVQRRLAGLLFRRNLVSFLHVIMIFEWHFH
jgi:hypothetical protein